MLLPSLLLYNIAIRSYAIGIRFAALFNPKAKLWVKGRNEFPVFRNLKGFKVWLHCASLGEFEQARPLIEKIKEQNPSCKVILSFFSPSGYEVKKNYTNADQVVYLPLDTPENANRFITELKPDLVLFVKYEFWFHFLSGLNQHRVPTVLFSSVFRNNQVFFGWYGSLFRNALQKFTCIFVQDEVSQSLLSAIGVTSIVANDTRFDRVSGVAAHKTDLPLIHLFKGSSKLLVAGSTWAKDEELITECINRNVLKDYKYIIVPHELDETRLQSLKSSIRVKARLYSELTTETASITDAVIIDNFGMLSTLYRYAEIAYVGGGFNSSVHNILEPAVYGLPVVFGPNYRKALEATELIKLKGAFSIKNSESLQETLTSLSNPTSLKKAADVSRQYVMERKGGTEVIYSYLMQQQFLPKG